MKPRRPPCTPPPGLGEPKLLHQRLYFGHRSEHITRAVGPGIDVVDLTEDRELSPDERARNVLLQGYLVNGRMLGLTVPEVQ
jgi:hypothetical protein